MYRLPRFISFLAALAPFLSCIAYADTCDDAMTSDAVARCLAQELRVADATINATYSALMARLDGPERNALRAEQRAWLRQRDADCELNSHERDRDTWYRVLLQDYGKTVCVTRYTRQRNEALADRLREPVAPALLGANAKVPPHVAPENKSLYRLLSQTSRQRGLWYFEVTIDPQTMSAPTDVWYGCRREHFYAGALAQFRGSDAMTSAFHGGIALDLEAGKVYVRLDRGWDNGQPGTSGGLDVKLAEDYRCGVETTRLLKPMLDDGAVRINLGDEKFFYPIPDGYRPFIDGGK